MKTYQDINFNLNKEHIVGQEVKPSTYKGIYSIHKYWSKKPPNIVANFIENFSREGEVVLDPFSGYGVTGIEALKLGRKSVLVDLNPIATFISKVIVGFVNLPNAKKIFKQLKETLKPTLDSLYKTRCPHCGHRNALATHFIHKDGPIRKIWFECPQCELKKGEKEPDREDLNTYQNTSYNNIPFWYPQNIKLFDNSRINSKRGMHITDFFTARNLHAISILYDEIEKIKSPEARDFFRFIFTASLPQMSNMVFVIKNRGKVTGKRHKPREEVGSWVIGYWIPGEHFEINVWRCFENRYKRAIKGKEQALTLLGNSNFAEAFPDLSQTNTNTLIKTANASELSFIPDESIDYIFTDPPHGDRIPYFELSALWASWLRMDLDFENEIVISNAKKRNKNIEDYNKRLYEAFKEMHRVLKLGRFMSVAFNNLDDKTWLSFLDILSSSGFEIVDASPMRYSAGSVVQNNRKAGLKSDFIFTCIKKKQPLKSYVYNPVVEKKENIRAYVMSAINRLREINGPSGVRVYQILDYVIPELVKQGKAFRISDIVEVSRQVTSEA